MSWLIVLLIFFSPIIKESEMSDKKKQIRSFLKNISKVESSGGKNFNHQEIKTGIHAGHKGMGRYGLMPNTVSEVITRLKRSGRLTPEVEKLKSLDPDTLKSTIETNPHLEDQIAEALAAKVLADQQDEEKAAFSWNQGHNLKPEKIAQTPYKESDYVKKYNAYKKLASSDEEGEGS